MNLSFNLLNLYTKFVNADHSQIWHVRVDRDRRLSYKFHLGRSFYKPITNFTVFSTLAGDIKHGCTTTNLSNDMESN